MVAQCTEINNASHKEKNLTKSVVTTELLSTPTIYLHARQYKVKLFTAYFHNLHICCFKQLHKEAIDETKSREANCDLFRGSSPYNIILLLFLIN